MMKVLYGVALLVGAALLFWAELLTSRLLLPLLGGSASVWNTSLVFFQVALLLGYLYAHASARWLTHRLALLIHPALLLAAVALLPISVSGLAMPKGDTDPVLWQLGALCVIVGAPFVILSGTASLLQVWFSRLGERSSGDPYFLYAASNFGSLAALVSYPTLVEPHLSLLRQSAWWTTGYVLLIALTAACAAVVLARGRGLIAPSPEPAPAPAATRPGLALRLRWLVLAFVPSSLLLGVTSHLTINVAATPLFWVIPLTLYLLSFVLAFQRLVTLPERWTVHLQALLLVALAVTLLTNESGASLPLFGLHLAAFFVTALLCHQEIARTRPDAAHLTEFYLIVSLGGALGGIFNALIAPLLFARIIEYPLVLVLACALRPGPLPNLKDWRGAGGDLLAPAAIIALVLLAFRLAKLDVSDLNGAAQGSVLILALIVFSLRARPVGFALSIAALIVSGAVIAGGASREVAHARNFYGVLRVVDRDSPPMRVLVNGTIDHGAQSRDPARRLQPLSYYHPDGPLGQLFAKVGGGPATRAVAVVGLGAGAVACYAHPGERWTFFEINPAVVKIARNPALFTFLRDCPAHPEIVMGDARLSLAREPDAAYDMIILDAFSSDAIPVHLMTREAMQLYLAKLRPGGMVVFHVSNQFLELPPVVANISKAMGLTTRLWEDPKSTDSDSDNAPPSTDYKDAADWMIVVRRAQDLGPIAQDQRWEGVRLNSDIGLWTDDYSNVFGAFLLKQQIAPTP
ncbi:MAG: spermidine synthase [Caulobacterales bacterium]